MIALKLTLDVLEFMIKSTKKVLGVIKEILESRTGYYWKVFENYTRYYKKA